MTKALIAGLAVAAATATVSAGTVTIEFGAGGRHNPLPGAPMAIASNRGGEFLVTGSLGPFSSFCLEYNEALDETTYDFTIDTGAVGGGLGGGNPDPLSRETAELYRQWIAGSLGPTGSQTQADFNNSIQDAFWYLEEELGDVDFDAATAAASGANFANLNATAQSLIDSVWGTTQGVGRVRVLNLTTLAGSPRQSILYITAIPLPGAGALALAGLVGVAAIRRRKM